MSLRERISARGNPGLLCVGKADNFIYPDSHATLGMTGFWNTEKGEIKKQVAENATCFYLINQFV